MTVTREEAVAALKDAPVYYHAYHGDVDLFFQAKDRGKAKVIAQYLCQQWDNIDEQEQWNGLEVRPGYDGTPPISMHSMKVSDSETEVVGIRLNLDLLVPNDMYWSTFQDGRTSSDSTLWGMEFKYEEWKNQSLPTFKPEPDAFLRLFTEEACKDAYYLHDKDGNVISDDNGDPKYAQISRDLEYEKRIAEKQKARQEAAAKGERVSTETTGDAREDFLKILEKSMKNGPTFGPLVYDAEKIVWEDVQQAIQAGDYDAFVNAAFPIVDTSIFEMNFNSWLYRNNMKDAFLAAFPSRDIHRIENEIYRQEVHGFLNNGLPELMQQATPMAVTGGYFDFSSLLTADEAIKMKAAIENFSVKRSELDIFS